MAPNERKLFITFNLFSQRNSFTTRSQSPSHNYLIKLKGMSIQNYSASLERRAFFKRLEKEKS